MPAYRLLSDELLIAHLKKGDKDAFAEIYARYAAKLAAFASSKLYSLEDAKDILHDMFVKLWEQRADISVTSNLQSYLFTIVRRRIIDKIRKNVTREAYASIIQSLAADYHSENAFETRELRQHIERSLNQVPPRVKEIYILSRNEGLNNREIADKLNLSEQTVKNQLSAALRHLRKSLTGFTTFTVILGWLLGWL
jgi:RNA polymerase sigma-70 factor (family 1)